MEFLSFHCKNVHPRSLSDIYQKSICKRVRTNKMLSWFLISYYSWVVHVFFLFKNIFSEWIITENPFMMPRWFTHVLSDFIVDVLLSPFISYRFHEFLWHNIIGFALSVCLSVSNTHTYAHILTYIHTHTHTHAYVCTYTHTFISCNDSQLVQLDKKKKKRHFYFFFLRERLLEVFFFYFLWSN